MAGGVPRSHMGAVAGSWGPAARGVPVGDPEVSPREPGPSPRGELTNLFHAPPRPPGQAAGSSPSPAHVTHRH